MIKIDSSAIEEIVLGKEEFDTWDSQRLVIGFKSITGKLFLDARKWNYNRDSNPPGYRPRDGLMMRIDHWPIVIQKIQEMLDKNQNA